MTAGERGSARVESDTAESMSVKSEGRPKGLKRNLQLLGILVFLVIVSVVLSQLGQGRSSSGFDKRLFAVDPNTVISDVTLKRPADELSFYYVDQNWIVNDEFLMDNRMRDTFFAILSSLEIRKPVAKSKQDSVEAWLNSHGVQVEISYLGEAVKAYRIGGDEQKGITYVKGEEGSFIARIPGFQNYVAGIFEVPELDWKNRAVFNTDWLSLAGLRWDYIDPGKQDIEFVPGKPLFTIENLPDIDSTRAMNYLEELIFLQVDRYISEEESNSYLTDPYLECTLEDRQTGTQKVTLYEPRPGDQLALLTLNNSQFALIRWSRVSNYFIEPADLTK